MPLPAPELGLVISYAYLWNSELDALGLNLGDVLNEVGKRRRRK